MSEVTDLIGRYKAGELTLGELAERFRNRRWPQAAPPLRPSSYLEMAARTQEDPGPDVPDSFNDVEALSSGTNCRPRSTSCCGTPWPKRSEPMAAGRNAPVAAVSRCPAGKWRRALRAAGLDWNVFTGPCRPIAGSTELPAGFAHPHASEEARKIAEDGMILRVPVGSGVHGTSITGQDDRDEIGPCLEARSSSPAWPASRTASAAWRHRWSSSSTSGTRPGTGSAARRTGRVRGTWMLWSTPRASRRGWPRPGTRRCAGAGHARRGGRVPQRRRGRAGQQRPAFRLPAGGWPVPGLPERAEGRDDRAGRCAHQPPGTGGRTRL